MGLENRSEGGRRQVLVILMEWASHVLHCPGQREAMA